MSKQWVIPDIHGCINKLRALVDDLIKADKSDRIYFLGDYIDRGPDSKGVIDYLRSKKESGFDFHFLLGNHEEYFLKSYDNEPKSKGIFKKKNRLKKAWFEHGGKETMESFGFENMNAIPEEYIQWIRELEYFLETKDYIFVHAGLNFKNEDPFEDKFAMLWTKDFEAIPEKIGYKKIIHGHVPVNIEFIDLNVRNNSYPFIDLDNGVYMRNTVGFGNLVALELNSMELLVQPNIDY